MQARAELAHGGQSAGTDLALQTNETSLPICLPIFTELRQSSRIRPAQKLVAARRFQSTTAHAARRCAANLHYRLSDVEVQKVCGCYKLERRHQFHLSFVVRAG